MGWLEKHSVNLKTRILVMVRSLRPNMIGINRYTLEIAQRLEGKLQIIVPHGLFQIGRGIPWSKGIYL